MIEQTHSEAFVLKSVPYGETDRILTLFTYELGIISAYLPGKSAPWIQPLSRIEVMITPGKGELYKLKEPKLLDSYMLLRDEFPRLKGAMQMADFVHRFLPPDVEKPPIYQLLKVYIERLTKTKKPENYLYSFILKTFLAEGVLEVGDESIQTEDFELPLYLSPLVTARKFDDIEAMNIHDPDKTLILSTLC